MSTQQLRTQTSLELANQLDDAYHELFNLRFQRASGQLTNTSRSREVRRTIARIKTILRERELALPELGEEENA